MKYVICEIKKLSGNRYVWIFMMILLAVNILLCLYTTQRVIDKQVPKEVVSDFFDIYTDESERIESEFINLINLRDEYNRLLQEALRQHDFDYEPEKLPNKYIESDIYNDLSLFEEVFNRKDYILSYDSAIQKVIDRAYANIAEFDDIGIPNDSYVYKYQLKVIELYKNVQSQVRMGLEYTRGWNEYFNYDIVNIFIFATLIMISAVVFTQEKSSGFLSIMRTSKNGRIKTALAKIVAMTLVTITVTLLFTLTTWAVFGARLGFSNPTNAIQVFKNFTYAPFIITVGQYFIITILVKLFIFILFSVLILMLSVFFYNYVIIYISGFCLFGLNFLLYSIKFTNADSPLKNLNFISVAAVNPLFVRYRSINFFGNVCGYVPFMIIAFSILIFTACFITVKTYSAGIIGIGSGHFNFFINIINKCKEKHTFAITKRISAFPKKQVYSRSIFLAETYKTIISKRYIIIVIGLLLVKVIISSNEFAPIKSYGDAVYKDYMTKLEGQMTDEKRQYIINERTFINDILSHDKEMREKFVSDEITYEEYSKYMEKYNYAYSRNEIFKRIEDHTRYIDQIKAEKDIDAWFVYDTGWNMLLHNNFDILLYIMLLILFAGSFADEYTSRSSSGSFIQILRTTKNGREKVFKSKIYSAVTITTLLTFVCCAVDITFIFMNYGFPAINAPLLSLHSFSPVDSNITLIKHLILFVILKLTGNILFTLFVCGLSELIRKVILVMSVTVAVTLFPALFVYFGLDIFKMVDFTGLLAVTPLYLLSASQKLFGDMGLLIIFISVAIISVSCILANSRKIYVN